MEKTKAIDKCLIHTSEYVINYCSKCDKLICKICLASSHPNHECIPIAQHINQIKNNSLNDINVLEMKIKKSTQILNNLNIWYNDFEKMHKNYIYCIKNILKEIEKTILSSYSMKMMQEIIIKTENNIEREKELFKEEKQGYEDLIKSRKSTLADIKSNKSVHAILKEFNKTSLVKIQEREKQINEMQEQDEKYKAQLNEIIKNDTQIGILKKTSENIRQKKETEEKKKQEQPQETSSSGSDVEDNKYYQEIINTDKKQVDFSSRKLSDNDAIAIGEALSDNNIIETLLLCIINQYTKYR